jgi:hypothetical protein
MPRLNHHSRAGHHHTDRNAMTSIAEHGPGGENKPPTIPALDLTPTGKVPHAAKAAGR